MSSRSIKTALNAISGAKFQTAPGSRSKYGELVLATAGDSGRLATWLPVRLSVEHSKRVAGRSGNVSIGVIGKLPKFGLVFQIANVTQNGENIRQMFPLFERVIDEWLGFLSRPNEKHSGQ